MVQNTRGSYKQYLKEYPKGKFADEARSRLENIFWVETHASNTIEGYRKYIQRYPSGQYMSQAREWLDERELQVWNIAKTSDDASSYKQYLDLYPKGKYIVEAHSRIKEMVQLAWQKARNENTVRAYRNFIKTYPDSEFVSRAKSILTDRAKADFQKALSANTVMSYKDFLTKHPTGPFANLAEARLIDLEVESIMQGKHGTLPTPTKVSSVGDRKYSVINIHNDTKYNLTIRYSGPESFKVIFSANEKGSIELLNGSYKVAASVNAINVRPFAGISAYDKGNYEITYYISTPFSPPRVSIPKIYYGSKPAFRHWPSKRTVRGANTLIETIATDKIQEHGRADKSAYAVQLAAPEKTKYTFSVINKTNDAIVIELEEDVEDNPEEYELEVDRFSENKMEFPKGTYTYIYEYCGGTRYGQLKLNDDVEWIINPTTLNRKMEIIPCQ
jgi:outer membrane protein assembly factor BamD (BamD/ComL family)